MQLLIGFMQKPFGIANEKKNNLDFWEVIVPLAPKNLGCLGPWYADNFATKKENVNFWPPMDPLLGVLVLLAPHVITPYLRTHLEQKQIIGNLDHLTKFH